MPRVLVLQVALLAVANMALAADQSSNSDEPGDWKNSFNLQNKSPQARRAFTKSASFRKRKWSSGC